MSTPGTTTPPPQSETQHGEDATLTLDLETKKEEVVETYSEHNEDPPEHDYLSGSKLLCVLSGLTLAGFLMLIDASIVATVSNTSPKGDSRSHHHHQCYTTVLLTCGY